MTSALQTRTRQERTHDSECPYAGRALTFLFRQKSKQKTARVVVSSLVRVCNADAELVYFTDILFFMM